MGVGGGILWGARREVRRRRQMMAQRWRVGRMCKLKEIFLVYVYAFEVFLLHSGVLEAKTGVLVILFGFLGRKEEGFHWMGL